MEDLIALKSGAAEGFLIRPEPALRDYIDAEYARCLEAASGLERDQFSLEPLDQFFRATLAKYDHPGS